MRGRTEALSRGIRDAAMTVSPGPVSPGPRADVDADLVEALRRENPHAAEQLVDRFGDPVYRLAPPVPRGKEDAGEPAAQAPWTAPRTVGPLKPGLHYG